MKFHLLATSFSSMICVSICHLFWDGFWSHFWWLFDTFPVRTCNHLNHQKHLFCNEFQWFCHSEKHDFWWVSWSFSLPLFALISDEFWYRFWLSFWIPLASNSMFFCWSFFWWIVESIFNWFLIRIGSKSKMTSSEASVSFRILFLHTCTFYVRKTYKCAMTVFTILEKQILME